MSLQATPQTGSSHKNPRMRPPKPRRAARRINIAPWLALATIVLAPVLVFMWFRDRRFALLAVYVSASLVTFCAYGMDKAAAVQKRQRTRENTLHLLALIGGWPGAFLAQSVFRHKSSKPSFQTVFFVTVIINCGVVAWLFGFGVSDVLRLLPGTRW